MPTSSTRADRAPVAGAHRLPDAGPDGVASLWWLDMTTSTDLSVLDESDRAWAAARPTRAAAQHVATGRALVRLVLGSFLDVDPRGVPLDRTCAACGRAHG